MEEENTIIENNKPKFWQDSNTLLTFSAIFISLGTLFILIYQTSLASKQFDLEQKQQLASVMPYVQIGVGHTTSDDFKIFITNNGIGPAFIKEVRVYYEGKIYENIDLAALINQGIEMYQGRLYEYANIFPGRVLPSNENVLHVSIAKGGESNINNDIFYSGKAELEIEYASIYDERWVVKGLFNEPIKTKGLTD